MEPLTDYIASIHSESDSSVKPMPSTVQFRRSSDARHSAELRCNAAAAMASAVSAASASLLSSQWQQTIAILSQVSASDATQGARAGHMVNAVNPVNMVNMVISAWARGSHWLQSLANLRRMQHAQVQPDTVSFNACLNALERSSKWQRGTDICFLPFPAIFSSQGHTDLMFPVAAKGFPRKSFGFSLGCNYESQPVGVAELLFASEAENWGSGGWSGQNGTKTLKWLGENLCRAAILHLMYRVAIG